MPTATITAPSTATYTTSSGRTIHTGDPGTFFTNTTGRALYQLRVSFINSCGICIQYSGMVGPPWPIPFHHGCRCTQSVVRAGATAPNPFVDFMDVIDSLPPDQRSKVIGKAALQLVDSGVAKFSDFVTGSRIRPLHEAVDRLKLSVKTMVAAGVKPAVAEAAHAAVNTPAHIAAQLQRQQLQAQLHAAGVHSNALIGALSKGLASRVSIAAGAGSVTKSGQQLPNAWGASRVLPPTAGDELARALLGMKLVKGAILVPKAKKPPEPKPADTAVPQPFEPPVEVAPAVPTYGPGEELPHFKIVAKSLDELATWDEENYANWRAGLGADKGQLRAVNSYITSGYLDINAVLRNKPGIAESLGGNLKHVKAEIANLDAALESAPRIPEDITVFRGIKMGPVLESMGIGCADLKPGMHLLDGGFVSTSPSMEFVKRASDVLEIRVPKGTVGAMVNPIEGELLLGRDINLRIISVSAPGTQTEPGRIVVEAIPIPRTESK